MADTSTSGTQSRQVVVFELNGESYAVDIKRVQEIIRYTTPRSVAGSDATVRGVINLRGRIIPVCDLKLSLGAYGGEEEDESAKIVVVESSQGVAGMIVDDVAEVLTLEGEQLDVIPENTVSAAFVDGVAKVGDRLILLLQPDRLFAADVFDFGDTAAADLFDAA